MFLPDQPAPGVLEDPISNTFATITTTPDHPFWNHTDQQWQAAATLDRGDRLFTTGRGQVVALGLLSAYEDGLAYNLTISHAHTYYVRVDDASVLVHNSGSCLPVLRDWQSQRFQFGNQNFLLDKRGMEHILKRHHPRYWDGSVKAERTFFDSSMSVSDVQDAIADVMMQNRDTLIRRGSNGTYQIRGTVNGVDYVLGLNNGRVAQFYST